MSTKSPILNPLELAKLADPLEAAKRKAPIVPEVSDTPPAPPKDEEPGVLPAPPVKQVMWRVQETAKARYSGATHTLAKDKMLSESSYGKDVIDLILSQGVKLERIEV